MQPFFSRSDRRRIASLVALGAAVLGAGCLGPPRRRPTGDWAPTLLSVRFDSARALEAMPSVVEDVVGVGGRVIGFRDDTLLIEPYYITMYDALGTDRERTFYRGGSYRLPYRAIVETGAGMVVSAYSSPATRKTRSLENAVGFGVDIFPVLLFLNVLKPFWHR